MTCGDYERAGVHAADCDRWLASLRPLLPRIGGFAALLPLKEAISGMDDPCLVTCADGVGTKVSVARAVGDFSTIGQDCVAMVLNDMVCCGARPLCFLDYIAMGRFDATQAGAVVEGIRAACAACDCELVGGETAELTGLLREGDFDVCGFAVGIVDRPRAIDGTTIRPGDVIVGLPSSGIHSNGLSLARRVLPEYGQDAGLARELLVPTRLYVRPLLDAWGRLKPRGIAHVTGGGIPGNLRRCLPPGADAVLDSSRWPRPAILDKIREAGGVVRDEMFRTFNMGIGMCVVVGRENEAEALAALGTAEARTIGRIERGSGCVVIDGVRYEG